MPMTEANDVWHTQQACAEHTVALGGRTELLDKAENHRGPHQPATQTGQMKLLASDTQWKFQKITITMFPESKDSFILIDAR